MMRIFFVPFLFIVLQLSAQTKYDQKETFNPQFYPSGGNDYRSASGEPGPKYWQNRADYRINCSLDTTNHRVRGEVTIEYTNNSPDNLKFLWLQLDQNIYKKDSRGSATTTESGGRWANAKFTDGYVIKSINIESGSKGYAPKYVISDTRMQIWLNETLKPAGAKTRINISFEFTIPEDGTDRMGRLKSRNGMAAALFFYRPVAITIISG